MSSLSLMKLLKAMEFDIESQSYSFVFLTKDTHPIMTIILKNFVILTLYYLSFNKLLSFFY